MGAIYKNVLRPLMFKLDAESAHEIGLASLRLGLGPAAVRRFAAKRFAAPLRPVERFGITFESPIGVAAGFDKSGHVAKQLGALGFGFVEVGTVTLRPQKGNERPRLFRLASDAALVNRLGFNNDGSKIVARRLAARPRDCIIGINIGKNRDVPIDEAAENYLQCFEQIYDAADYIAVNVSSPNTPNLRELQRSDRLDEILSALQNRNRELSNKPILVKLSPDEPEPALEQTVDCCTRNGVAGIIAVNTTVSRDGLSTAISPNLLSGGVSGKPLREKANKVIRDVYRLTKGKIPIIGVGGVFTADDAFEKFKAGASLVQAYTGFVYGGPFFARDINLGLSTLLDKHGVKGIDAIVGV